MAELERRVVAAGGITWVSRRCGDETEARRLAMAYFRGQETGSLTTFVADELSYRLLDLHPMLVFGDIWLDVDDDGRQEHDQTRGKEDSNSAYSRGCRCRGCTDAHRVYVAHRRAVAR